MTTAMKKLASPISLLFEIILSLALMPPLQFCLFEEAELSLEDITTYEDPDLLVLKEVFSDGMTVYFTAQDSKTIGGAKNALISNGKEIVSTLIYDNGTFPDKYANDGVYTGHFRVSTLMTVDVLSDPERPKIVDCIQLGNGEEAVISVDLDGDGTYGTKTVKLAVLSDIEATTITNDSAVIVWTTSIPSTSHVEYWVGEDYHIISHVDENPRICHSTRISELKEATTYHFRVVSVDVYGNTYSSQNHVFTTITSEEVETIIKSMRSDNGTTKTYYVSLKGNDSNNGLTIETAWRHVAYAVSRADVGDVIYVLDGEYEDEHIVFEKSGIDIAPIRLLAYNGTPVLDGLDGTGTAIRIRDKAYIEIAGFEIRNYGIGLRGEDFVHHLLLHNFKMENISGDGLCFDGASLQNSKILNFTLNEIGYNSGTAITHFAYSGTDCYNVEIANFNITNAHGEGINWRNSKRIHIHHAYILDVGGDAVHLQLDVHGCVVNDVYVKNTGWHGIAIHDHTVGYYPCYNNIIRNCYVCGAKHNDIDLHSGAYNTLIEECHLDGPPQTGQGIYFHNLGAGLIARNNLIHDTGDGIDGGPIEGEYLQDIIIENNTICNCTGISWQGSTRNVVIKGNKLYNVSGTPIYAGAYNILIEENSIEGKTYRINSGNGTVIDALDEAYYVKSSWGANVTVKYNDGRVFERKLTYHHGSYVLDAPRWYPWGSCFSMKSTSEPGYNGIVVRITTYPLNAIPTVGFLNATINTFNASANFGEVFINFTVESVEKENLARFTVFSLEPWVKCEIFKDGMHYAYAISDSAGKLMFNHSEWNSTHTFTVIPFEKADATPPIIGEVIQTPENVGPNEPAIVLVEVFDDLSGISTVILSYSTNKGETWHNITMNLMGEQTYSGQIPGFLEGTVVWYKIIAYDNAGNFRVSDNGQYYVYAVVPDFSATYVVPLMLSSLIIAILAFSYRLKRKRENYEQS